MSRTTNKDMALKPSIISAVKAVKIYIYVIIIDC